MTTIAISDNGIPQININGDQIQTGSILNDQIAANANIDVSKLNHGNENQVLTTTGGITSWQNPPNPLPITSIPGQILTSGTTSGTQLWVNQIPESQVINLASDLATLNTNVTNNSSSISTLNSKFPINTSDIANGAVTNAKITGPIAKTQLANIDESQVNNLVSDLAGINSTLISNTSSISSLNTSVTNLNSNFPITDTNVSSSANIAQSKINGLTTLASNVATNTTNISTLQGYFPIADANVSSTANIQQSKIQNLSANIATINAQIAALQTTTQTNVTYINQGTSSTIDTLINSASSGTCFALSPGTFTLSNPASITASINAISLSGFAKSYLSTSNTNTITGLGSFTLKVGNLQFYFCNLTLGCTTLYVQGGNSSLPTTLCFATENCNINAGVTIENSYGFCNFTSTAFNGAIVIANTCACTAIYFADCNFQNSTITNNSSTPIYFTNCLNLNSLSVTGSVFAGFTSTYAGNSYNFTTVPQPYNSVTKAQYKWVGTDLSSTAAIADGQITGLSYSKLTGKPTYFPTDTSNLTVDSAINMLANLITSTASNSVIGSSGTNLINKAYADASYDALNSSVNTSRLNANSGITMGTNLITCTATNTNIGASSTNLITKSYADATYATGSGFASLTNDQTFTGYNQFNNSIFRIYNTLNNLQFYINSGSYDNIKMTNTIGDNVILGYDLNIAYWRYNTTRWGDQYSNSPFNLIIGNSRATSYLDLPLPVSVCDNTPGLILIGSGNNRNTASGNNIVIGGNGSASYIQIGGYGGSNQGQIVIGSTNCSGFFQLVKNGNNFGFSNSSASSYITPGSSVITTSSSLDYKLNIINKTDTYITNATTPIKNYLQKILQMPIYTYTYKKYSMDPLTNPNGSYSEEPSDDDTIYQSTSFEYWYANFSHGIGTWVPTLTEGTKPDPSSFQKLKTIGTGELCNYLVLALQEQNKFVIQPLQARVTALENFIKLKFPGEFT